MFQYKIKLKSFEDIHEFVKTCNKIDCDTDLSCGRTTVDAKSLLGVISLDIRQILYLSVNTDCILGEYDMILPYLAA